MTLAESVPRGVFPNISERVWQGHVERLARTLGYRCYHTFLSARSEPGFPDLVLVRPASEGRRGRVVFVECKTLGKNPTDHQQAWLNDLAAAGAEVYCWRPGDEALATSVLQGEGA